jgi:DNA-binding response OmpR family regulator
VTKIQSELIEDLNSIDENVLKLRKKLGNDMIYGYLRTIREVGHFDVDFLWKHFG